MLWLAGRASPGDVTYVLTIYFVIHGYLRDVGMHINNLQRSVNDMEELVAIQDEPIGIADAPDARPITIGRGEIVFDDVTFHYGGHARRSMTGCRSRSAPASASAWSGVRARARRRSSS